MMVLAAKGDNKSDDEDFSYGTYYEILKCHSCPEVTLRCHEWHDLADDDIETEYRILYPAESRMPLGMPEKIEKAYFAALKVKAVDANAFGVLIGRVMDMVCQDRGATGRFLGLKLADLAAKGEVPQKLVQVAERLTKLRNVGAHAELGELTAKEVPVVEDLCRALLDYIYTAPHLATRADDTLTNLLSKQDEE